MNDHFTWIPLYKELATNLLDWETRQKELIDFIENIKSNNIKVTPLMDRGEDDDSFLLREIDPFTFFGIFNRGISDKERIAILKEIKVKFELQSHLPNDFNGIPILNNQRSWFFAYLYHRKKDDIAKLWYVFRLALDENPVDNHVFHEAFDNVLQVWGVNINLTMGLFWIRPDQFLNLDKKNRDYLNIKLPSSGLSSEFYFNTVRSVFKSGKPFPEISYNAWLSQTSSSIPLDPAENNYWLVGANWEGVDQTQRFLDEGIWQNGYDDKYLEEVKSTNIGDKIAIKAVSTQKWNLPFDARGHTVSKIIIKARGTVISNRNDGQTIEVEWDQDFEPRDWYFFTYRSTVWHLKLERSYPFRKFSQKLVDFIWNNKPQEYEWFLDEWYGSEPLEQSPLIEKDIIRQTKPYSIDDIIESGVFLDKQEILQTLDRLQLKKNLILQGSPGVGKTFIARKLAYAIMEEVNDDRIEMVQFHQSYCYEDFVRGYRPMPDDGGKFGLQDAIFYKFCKKAEQDPDNSYVFIIDEINRGNLSQIFGELLMLIEADKRGQKFAVPLMYNRPGEGRFSLPNNIYIIGMMNLADRSLAIVDYALRRRFAFMTLTPKYNSPIFRKWLQNRNMDPELIDLILSRMNDLNREIADNPLLGVNYMIGHSYFCPKGGDFSELNRGWYEGIIETEIVPMIKEYWFDDAGRVNGLRDKLLAP